MKWDMGWMHDTLAYMRHDPVFRKFHHNEITFRMMYAFSENFVLPLSHDEVVHGKGSLLDKMWGVDRDKFAGLRLLFGYMWAQPGKKLLFMGGEFGQEREWDHEQSLDWHLLHDPRHAGVLRLVSDLNRLYREEPALHELDTHADGFEWVDANDSEASVITFLRRGRSADDAILVACNFTPMVRHNYLVGVPDVGRWTEVLNTDAETYGGAGHGNLGGVDSLPYQVHGRPRSINLTLPPLGAVFLKGEPSPR
jgi:1,4-alpha-glucan branching enzyme